MAYARISRTILWWVLFLMLGLGLQTQLPGVDALIPGLIVACQEKDARQIAWVMLVSLLVQEGTGSLAFGGGMLWYGALLVLFRLGEFLFKTDSLFFVILLSIALGLVHAGIQFTFGSLQNLSLTPSRLLEHAVIQALIIPPLWGAARLTRKWMLRHDDGI